MPLTRHLYRQDEVAAALQFCLVRNRPLEAAFWTQELIDSGLAEELMAALKQVWMYGFGVKALGWYRAFVELFRGDEIAEEEIVRLVSWLCRLGSKKDRSILTLLSGTVEPDRVNVCQIPEGFSPVEAFAFRAILQRKTIAAWGAVCSLESADFLKRVAAAKHGVEGSKFLEILDESLESRAIAVAALCLSKAEFAASWSQQPGEILEEVAAERPIWEDRMGRRSRRMYKIPPECLGLTERGKLSVYESNEKEIIGRLTLCGSPFWDSAVEAYGGWAMKDRARESFYDTNFPDDIPDEWSLAERAKSHGRGASTDMAKTIQSWYGHLPCTLIWKPLKYAAWNLRVIPGLVDSWALQPVRRIIRPGPVELVIGPEAV